VQQVVVEKPYEFIPPHRGNWWPTIAQRLRLIDRWLRKEHGVTTWECRHTDRLRNSLDQGHGILLTPNHARPCDPIVMGWLAREARTHVFAMASNHLYHQDKFTAFAIRKMGGFSVNREGIDRQAINTAVDILTTAERPLIVFPEGAVTRTNDRLQALLDGVGFIARSAAKKRLRATQGGKVVVHPVAIKYVFQDDIRAAVDPVLTDIEHRLTWRPQRDLSLMDRITKVGLTLLGLKEIEHFGAPQEDRFQVRLEKLIDHLLHPLENEWLGEPQSGPIVPRVKALRMQIVPDMVRGEISTAERDRRWRHLENIYLAQQVDSYPHDYLETLPTVDRILETVERFEEDITDEARVVGDLHVIIEVGEAIEVPDRRDRTAAIDPLMVAIRDSIQQMLDQLSQESALISELEASEARETKRTLTSTT
jgi:1-acyl-sn-glycerol-3-phosphate acyltransferase